MQASEQIHNAGTKQPAPSTEVPPDPAGSPWHSGTPKTLAGCGSGALRHSHRSCYGFSSLPSGSVCLFGNSCWTDKLQSPPVHCWEACRSVSQSNVQGCSARLYYCAHKQLCTGLRVCSTANSTTLSGNNILIFKLSAGLV